MDVLIAVASRHGASLEIGEAIASELRSNGLHARLEPVEAIASLEGLDAVVLGSGVYAGHWLGPARDFVDRHEAALRERPVWLFSSGPLGDPPKPDEAPAEAGSVSTRVGARGHKVFAGRIDRSDLGFAEKAILKVVRAPEGDFRPWSEIADWASGIAASLITGAPLEDEVAVAPV
jgi:menaquinone-dependent protoporphyrinogen oxidase